MKTACKSIIAVILMSLLTSSLSVSVATPVSAQEVFTITVGENKVITFTEPNHHYSLFENDPNNPIPWPDQREAYSEGNIAYVSLSATPGHAGVARSGVGVNFEWDLGPYTWEEVKDWPVKVTIHFSYHIEAHWAAGNGSANATIGLLGLTGWHDSIGYEAGQSGSRGDTVSETHTTTVEELGGDITMEVYCQAHSVDDPDGTTHYSSAEVQISSIEIEILNPQITEFSVALEYLIDSNGEASYGQLVTATAYHPQGSDHIESFVAIDPTGKELPLLPEECNVTPDSWGFAWIDGGLNPPAFGTYTIMVTDKEGRFAKVTSWPTDHISDHVPTIIDPVNHGYVTTRIPTFKWEPFSDRTTGYLIEVAGPPEETLPGEDCIWRIGLPSSQTEVLFNSDGTAAVPQLTPGKTYALFVFAYEDESSGIQSYRDTSIRSIEFTVKPVRVIKDITVQGVGTTNNVPETGSPVRLEANIEVPTGYEVTKCSWTGDLTPGEGDPANNCRYDYTPGTGPGPDKGTYGPKDVTLTVTYKVTATDETGQDSKDHTYKVFFEKKGDDDGDCHWWPLFVPCEPNWVEYWRDDGAVPALNDPDVSYNHSLSSVGRHRNGQIEIGPDAAGSEPHYTIPSGPHCPGANLGGGAGIDEVALTIAHEKRHKEIWSNWQSGGIWVGMTDSDYSFNLLGPNYDDDLPDNYEINDTHTATDTVDSCSLGSWPGWESYKYYGDNEFQARLAEIDVKGNADKDWANPGKQSNPPFTAVAQAQLHTPSPIGHSGAASPNATHSDYAVQVNEMAGLTGSYSDTGVDTDGDGLYDSLKLSVGIHVTDASTYNLIAWLEDGIGTETAWASIQSPLSAGTHTVDLSFDGLVIRGSGLDGPYNVARVELRAADDELLFDAADDAHTTAAYQHTDFDFPDVAFTGSFSDAGVDTNTDGLYDLLRINVGLDVQEAGTYTVIGELEGSDSIAVVRTTTSLDTGSQAVDLDFDGQLIFQHRQDGPYQLRRLRVEDTSGNRIDFIYDAYTTSAYTYSQFQHSGTTIDAASYSDQGLDMDSDGDYDYLHVEFQVNVDREGPYRLLAALNDSEGETIASMVRDLDLLVGSNPISLHFPGGAIYGHGVDGPYQVTSVALLDVDGTIVDYQRIAHATQAYSYLDFDTEGLKVYLPIILKQ